MKSDLELWQLTSKWLVACGNKISNRFIKEQLTTHPDYPAMTSIVDFLEQGNFAYSAVISDINHLNNFKYPLLAHFKETGREYFSIIKSSDEFLNNENNKWSGIVLFPGSDTKWENEDNNQYLKLEFRNKVFQSFLLILSITFIIYASIRFNNSLNVLLYGLGSVLGIYISYLLIKIELGYQGLFLKKVCGAVKEGGCEKVLKSKYAVEVFGLSPADFSILYFLSQFLIFSLTGLNINYINSIYVISLFGIIISFWSVFTQIYKIKQYCFLCLNIAFILFLQSIISFNILRNNSEILLISKSEYLKGTVLFIFFLFIFISIYKPVKNLINLKNKISYKLIELNKWKYDVEIFLHELSKMPVVDTTIWEKDLIFGNHDSSILITVACNPYCNPCSIMHEKINKVLEKHKEKIKVQIRFLFDINNLNDPKTIAVNKIIQKSIESDDVSIIHELLNDWFDLMDIELWNKKWNPDNNINTNDRLLLHSKWMQEASILHTPTLFINGKKIPNRYTIEDVEILIPNLFEYKF
jgi:uncharacterized membrane protein